MGEDFVEVGLVFSSSQFSFKLGLTDGCKEHILSLKGAAVALEGVGFGVDEILEGGMWDGHCFSFGYNLIMKRNLMISMSLLIPLVIFSCSDLGLVRKEATINNQVVDFTITPTFTISPTLTPTLEASETPSETPTPEIHFGINS